MPNQLFPVKEVLSRVSDELLACSTKLSNITPGAIQATHDDLISIQSIDLVEQTLRALQHVVRSVAEQIPEDVKTPVRPSEIFLAQLAARLRGEALDEPAGSGECDFF